MGLRITIDIEEDGADPIPGEPTELIQLVRLIGRRLARIEHKLDELEKALLGQQSGEASSFSVRADAPVQE